MIAKIDNEYGSITISNNVIASIAGTAIRSAYGIVGMAYRNTKDGIVSLLKPNNITRGVKITVEENEICIDMHIIVEYGYNILTACENIRGSVKYLVAELTGFAVRDINIYVESVRVTNA